MTNDELEIHKARLLGAQPADIERLRTMQGQRQAMEDTLAIQQEFDRVLEQRKIEEATTGVRGYIESIKDMRSALQDVTLRGLQKMEDSFVELIKGTKSVGEAFSDMAASIVADLIRIQVQQSIMQPLAGFLGIGGGGGGNMGNGLSFGNILGSLGSFLSFDGGGFTGYGSRSGGLDGKGGFMAMLHPNETVTDHTKGQSAGETVVVQQTINVTTGVQQTVRAEIMGLMPRIAEASKQAVLDARRRGGSFSSAFGAS